MASVAIESVSGTGQGTDRAQELLQELSRLLQDGDPNADEQARQDALRASMQLTASLRAPEELAFETCFLPAFGACCRAAVQLGLFEAVAGSAGPISASELAAKTGGERLLIIRLLRVITGLGLVAEAGVERYSSVPATHAMATHKIRAAQQHFWDQGVASLLHLPAYLESNGARCPTDARNGLFQHAFSTSLDAFSYWQAQPPPRKALDNFNFLMTCVRGQEPAWLSWFPAQEQILGKARPGEVIMVDVGGGRGHDISAFLNKYRKQLPPSGRLVLEDLPAVLDDVETLDDAIERVPYDFFTPQSIQGARIYYYAHILHDWSDEACVRILRSARPAMTPGNSRIYLYEFILPDKGCSLLQAGFDLQMMGMHAGMERTRAQWTALLQRAGFGIVNFWEPPGGDGEGIIEAEVVSE